VFGCVAAVVAVIVAVLRGELRTAKHHGP
jgi:hypothetical protein